MTHCEQAVTPGAPPSEKKPGAHVRHDDWLVAFW